jgi:hypothetical protein
MAITKPVPGSINAPLGSQQESGVNAFGGVNILKIRGLSSDLTTVAQNIATATGGDVEIEDIIVMTDATGIVGPTTFELLSDDAIGLAIFASMAVSSLGANTTHDFGGSTPLTVYGKRVIHNGSHLQVLGTVAVGTGAGVWELFVQYRPCVQTAVLQ